MHQHSKANVMGFGRDIGGGREEGLRDVQAFLAFEGKGEVCVRLCKASGHSAGGRGEARGGGGGACCANTHSAWAVSDSLT